MNPQVACLSDVRLAGLVGFLVDWVERDGLDVVVRLFGCIRAHPPDPITIKLNRMDSIKQGVLLRNSRTAFDHNSA